MTAEHPLAGVYAAAVTPLREQPDSSLDLESVPLLMRFSPRAVVTGWCSSAPREKGLRSHPPNVKR